MCRYFSCVVERGCLLWPVHSLGKTLLAFALLHSVLQGQICLLLQVSFDFLLVHTSPLWWKGHLFWVVVLQGLKGLHRTVQLLQHYWLGHRLGLLWYWMNGLPWKSTEIFLSFSTLHPSTAFHTADVEVSSGLQQGQGLWVQQTWVTQYVAKPSCRRSPITPPQSCQADTPQTAEQLYQRNAHTVKKFLGTTTDFPIWGSGKETENPLGIWLWRPVGFDYRPSTGLGK